MSISPRVYIARITSLGEAGYEYHEKTNWWFCDKDKLAVDDYTIRVAYDNFMDLRLNAKSYKEYTFHSYKRINPDILETIYRMRFPKQGFLTERKDL